MLATFTQEARDQAVVLSICGEIDLSNSPDMGQAINIALQEECESLILVLTQVTYLDSTCLRELVRARKMVESDRRTLFVVAPPASIARKILERSGLIEFLDAVGSIEEALESGQHTQL